MKDRKFITPVPGRVYTNHGGGSYQCTDKNPKLGEAWFTNTRSGWSCLCHGVQEYEDGSIEWDYSTEGSFLSRYYY